MRALALLAGTMANFFALRYLPLTVTAALFFTVPLWICVLSIPMLGERVGPRRWAAVAVGFAGVLVVIRPWGAEAHWAMVLAIGTALAASLYSIFTRRLSGVDSAATQQFYAAAIATALVAPFSFAAWVWPTAPSDILAFVAIGGFAFAGHQLMTIAHRFAPASVLAPFTYAAIIYLTASSWLIFGDAPDFWVFAGAAVVVASGLYIWMRERRLASPPAAV
jgi:drug/metabolite transporter (DMT)-like permease